MHRFLGILVASVLVQLSLAACGGSDNKPPLTPDGPSADLGDAGDVVDPAAAPAMPSP